MHFGSIGLMSKDGERATEKAVSFMRKNGGKISYDPNLRPRLWESEKEMRRKVMLGLKHADILKVDLGELEFMTGKSDVKSALGALPDMELVCVTLGKDGCHYYHSGELHTHSGYRANAVDSTGAGDAFVAGLLFGLEQGWDIARSVDFANATGAVSTFKRFPNRKSVEDFIKKR